MKAAQLLKTTIVLTLLAIGLLFNGCANDNPTGIQTGQTADGKTIKFIPLFDTNSNSLNKVTTVSKYISKSSGGNLHFYHIANTGSPKPEVMVDLNVPANAIDYSKTITATFDDFDNIGEADLVFGPHGTQFSNPALLTMECKNFNLSGLNPNNIKFYYVNPSGQWVVHPAHEIYVNVQWGTIRVVNAQIPHFSRYAIGVE